MRHIIWGIFCSLINYKIEQFEFPTMSDAWNVCWHTSLHKDIACKCK
nr:MAG TPA: hypothetical protein [Caudoviricetes sp.]